ncbi:uncharacterized protein LOC134268973 [Saccostrea cucullata]|uniref:uncharacterized protein LOC134268973 n=1 Tax=Saccostrea cuccullata TaxID=36930 RepID=UPI002ED056CC
MNGNSKNIQVPKEDKQITASQNANGKQGNESNIKIPTDQQRKSTAPSNQNRPTEKDNEISIPIRRGQITQDMFIRGTKLDSLTDFKVSISLTMSGIRKNYSKLANVVSGDLSQEYLSTAKIVRIFTSSTFTVNGTDNQNDKELLRKWYKRDDNALPSVCVLQTISKLLPDYLSHDQEKKKAAKNVWWNESDALQKILIDISQKELGEEKAMKYIISITHLEVLKGILECSNASNRCLWFKRTIKDIENVEPSWQLSRYIECLGQEEKWQNSRRLLNNLKQKMVDSLPSDNIHEYVIPWTEKGVDPSLPEHKQYLQQINEDFEHLMLTMIDKAIVEREKEFKREPMLEECLQHLEFCRKKSRAFGRDQDLQKIKSYLQGTSRCPFVDHATSGSGKTTLMAMAASRTKSWLTENVSVIMRFVGTTSESTDIIPFLQYLAQQIKEAKGKYAFKAEGDFKHILSDFQSSLIDVSKDKPIVLFIDALDQFSASNGARELLWLPKHLPDNVKLVVSTLEDAKYECFRKLKVVVKEDTNFLQLRPFTKEDIHQIINGWLGNDNRTLTPEQRFVLISAFNETPLALFLKLSYDTASTWTSYYSVDQNSLEKTVRASINRLFQRLEVLHGELLTSRAFGYLTAAKIGLSEAELEDILSCDDDVLNDVYMYWTPPVRRLPPLLLVRLKASLEDKHYIVERGVDGILVMYWYHRQFSEAAYDRYCADTDARQNLHAGLADFFSGAWAEGKMKPYTDRQGNTDSADRQAAEQPFQNGDHYNTRKLNNLAYHRIMSLDLQKSKQECLFNFNFLIKRLKGTSVRQLLEDFETATDVFPSDKAIDQILQTLKLSESVLMNERDSLVSQMLGRLPCTEETEDFLQQCRDSGVTYIQTNRSVLRRPGGQLKHALHGDDEDVMYLDMSRDGKTVVTSALSNIVKLWDVQRGKLIRSIEDLDKLVRNVNFINNDTGILVRTSDKLLALTLYGDIQWTIPLEHLYSLYCIGGPEKTILCLYRDDRLQFYDLCDGNLTHSTTTQGTILTDPNGYNKNDNMYSYRMEVSYGTDTFMALVDNSKKLFTMVDLESKTTSKFCRVFQDIEHEIDVTDNLEIDAIAITKDNKHVIVASMMQNDLILFDARTLEKIQCIPGNSKLVSEKFKISNDGRFLYSPCNSYVLLYDLETWERTAIFRHSHSIHDVQSVDAKTFVTICGDFGIWIWDKDGEEAKGQMDGFIGTSVSDLMQIPNSYYVVTLTSHKDDHYIQVHHAVKKIKVRQSKLYKDQKYGSDFRPRIKGLISDKTILMRSHSRQLKNVSLETLKPTVTYQGRTAKYAPVAIFSERQEIATTTRGGSHIKIQCSQTGRTKCVIRIPQSISKKIEMFESGFRGSLLLVFYQESPRVSVIDIASRQERYIIDMYSELGFSTHTLLELKIAPDDSFILFTERKTPKGYKPGSKRVYISVVYDVQSRNTIELFDRYQDAENTILRGTSKISIFGADILDDNNIVTSHEDGSMRVWNSKTGEVLKRLGEQTSSPDLISSPGNPYFLSNGESDTGRTFRVWSKDTFQSVSSFKLDKKISRVLFLDGNRGFVSCESNPARLIHWTVEGTSDAREEAIHDQVSFTGQVLNLETNLVDECDIDNDDDKLDDDEDEISDEESDDG